MGVVVPFEEARDPAESLKPLLEIVADDMQAVNRIILDKAVSDVELIPELAHHLIDSGGKRLRPMLTIAAAKLCGYRRRRPRAAGRGGGVHAHRHAAARRRRRRERLRRGKASARLVWGNQASVLVGDFLLGQAFRMMVDVGSLRRAQDPVQCRRRDCRRRGDAAGRRQEHGHHRGRLPRHHQRQDGRAVLGGHRGGRRDRQSSRRGADGAQVVRPQSRRCLPAGRRCARLLGRQRAPRQVGRRRFPRGQDHAAGDPVLPPRQRRSSARSGSAR